ANARVVQSRRVSGTLEVTFKASIMAAKPLDADQMVNTMPKVSRPPWRDKRTWAKIFLTMAMLSGGTTAASTPTIWLNRLEMGRYATTADTTINSGNTESTK